MLRTVPEASAKRTRTLLLRRLPPTRFPSAPHRLTKPGGRLASDGAPPASHAHRTHDLRMHRVRCALPRRATLLRVQPFLPSRGTRRCLPGLRAANPAQRSFRPGGVSPTLTSLYRLRPRRPARQRLGSATQAAFDALLSIASNGPKEVHPSRPKSTAPRNGVWTCRSARAELG